MADDVSQSTIDDTERMLDAFKGLCAHRHDASQLRTMFGASSIEAEPAKALVTKVGQNLQQLEPSSSRPAPPL